MCLSGFLRSGWMEMTSTMSSSIAVQSFFSSADIVTSLASEKRPNCAAADPNYGRARVYRS